jgi:hypothetical protein
VRTLVKERGRYEDDMLNVNFRLSRAALAARNEHAARIQFKEVLVNPAKWVKNLPAVPVEIDTEIDLMFQCPGIPLCMGSQRKFTKLIRSLKPLPQRKQTLINLDRIRCAVQEISDCTPTDAMIWTSIRSGTLQRLTREFYWKCVLNTFRVGDFWEHIQNSEIFGICNVTETLEHIALECNAPERRLIWDLTHQLWSWKYSQWPTLNWGLILG